MKTNWIEEFNKQFELREHHNGDMVIGSKNKLDLSFPTMIDFITTLIEKQREEYVDMIEEYFKGLIVISNPQATKENLINLIK